MVKVPIHIVAPHFALSPDRWLSTSVANISRAELSPAFRPPRNPRLRRRTSLLPLLPDRQSNVSRFRTIDAYVALAFKNNQISFGQQALWWGPASGDAMLFSDNAESIPMLRYDRVSPFKLPGFLGVLGPMRVQFFIGRLSGQQFVHHRAIPSPGKRGFR